MHDSIHIVNAKFDAILGTLDYEQKQKQEVYIDIEVKTDTSRAGRTDKLKDTIDTRWLHSIAQGHVDEAKFQLQESLAQAIAQDILKDNRVDEVRVHIRKPEVLKHKNVEHTGVSITRHNT